MTASGERAVGWAVLGTGVLADNLVAPVISRHPDASLTAVVSRDPGRARAFGERHGAARAYDDLDAVLGDEEVDVVYVATPNAQHAAHTLAALDAGKHVLVEKPMALEVDDGRAMVDAARRRGLTLGVGFHLRHKPGNRAAAAAIRDGGLGRVFFGEIEVGADKSFYPYHTWRSDPALSGGGTVLNQGTHATDLARFLTGAEIASVSAATSSAELEDVFAATCTMTDGTIVAVTSHQLLRGTRPDFVVFGEEAWLQARGGTAPFPGEEVSVHRGEDTQRLESSREPAYWHEVDDLIRTVRGEGAFSGTGEDGLAGILAARAIYESARSGRRVDVAG